VESSGIPFEPQPPREIAAKKKAYAFERSCGLPMAAACRAAGGKVENGDATKWERSRGVQAWIAWYRALPEELLAAKRDRVEAELNLIGHANMDDFVTLVPSGSHMIPVLDLSRIHALPDEQRRSAMAAVKTIRYTEHGPTFELHGKLDALAQVRDMWGMKAPAKVQHAGEGGGPIEVTWKQPGAPSAPALESSNG